MRTKFKDTGKSNISDETVVGPAYPQQVTCYLGGVWSHLSAV